MKKLIATAACIALCAISTEALAQASVPQDFSSPAKLELFRRLSVGGTLERYLDALRKEFTRLDADGNGTVEQTDFDLKVALASANMRSLFAMQIMGADLNDDGVVTERELRLATQYVYRKNGAGTWRIQRGGTSLEAQVEGRMEKLMAADTDRDGRITWKEATEFAKRQPEVIRAGSRSAGAIGTQWMALAPAGKSSLTWPELEAAGTAFFKSVDEDGDGTTSPQELNAARRRANRAH